MNFKKGGSITKKKLMKENAQSLVTIRDLMPSNGQSLMKYDIQGEDVDPAATAGTKA